MSATRVEMGPVVVTNFDSSERIDLTPGLLEIDVFDDVFAPTMSATVTVVDASGVRTKLPIIGDERVSFSFKTPGEKRGVSVDMKSYRVTPVQLGDRAQVYTVSLSSDALLHDPKGRVHRAYGPRTVSETAKLVFDEFIAQHTKKTLVLEKTEGLRELVLPGHSPLATMQYLAGEAGPGYVFFERNDAFFFVPLETLMALDPTETYYEAPNNVGDAERLTSSSKIITKMVRLGTPDTMRNVGSGYLGSTTGYIDLLNKTFGQVTYDYERDFGEFRRVGKNDHPVVSSADVLANVSDCMQRLLATTVDCRQSAWEPARMLAPRGRENFAGSGAALVLQLIDTVRFSVVVPGNSGLMAGQTVDLVLPDRSGDRGSLQSEERFESGRYLVTATNHKIDRDARYFTVMECAKASYENRVRRVAS